MSELAKAEADYIALGREWARLKKAGSTVLAGIVKTEYEIARRKVLALRQRQAA